MAWNKPSEAPKVAPKKPSAMRGIVAGIVTVCALGGLCLWMFSGGDDAPKTKADKGRGRIKEVRPAKIHKRVHETPKTVAEVVENVEEMPKPLFKVKPIPPEEWNRLTNRMFHTGTEQVLCWVFTTEPGSPPLPIPALDEEEKKNIVSILISKEEPKPDDDEITAYCKEQVAAAKKEMLKYLHDGGSPEDFLRQYYDHLHNMFEMRDDAVDQIREFSEENPDLQDELLAKVNEKFAQDGIKQITKEEL